jgi:DNA-binding transcriptional ArsR family regulator
MPTTKPKRPAVDFTALTKLFYLAADPARAQILLMLGEGEHHVGDLCDEVGHSMLELSYHLRLLQIAGLVEFRWNGKRDVYMLTDAGRELLGVIEALGA